ncbi:Rieske 2Fe-2S domain-containing protein [Thalassospira sp. MA62]|nr:Rieske 2Fe-2S domain-containing protein [Thalassospira sp. MA62]
MTASSRQPTPTSPDDSTDMDGDGLVYVICGFHDVPSRKALGFCLMRLDDNGDEKPWPIIVVRWGRHVFAYDNLCPHHDVHLDWEKDQFFNPTGTRLMCGKHGSLFDLATGECLEGPCLGRNLNPVPIRVIDDDICVVGVRLADEDDGQ